MDMSDPAPNCAICYGAPDTCPCESERLAIAVEQAERRRMDEQLARIRYASVHTPAGISTSLKHVSLT